MSSYQDKNRCVRCGGFNRIDIKLSMELTILECETECKRCGHKDYWSTGFFHSSVSLPEPPKCKLIQE